MPSDGDRLIALLDRKKCIKYKLYKHHMNKVIIWFIQMKGPYGKDLSRLGRDLEKVVLIDTCKDVDSTNTIVIAPWKGKKNDA
jgi:TFIIF-interacting CTD phosphatase-like protein